MLDGIIVIVVRVQDVFVTVFYDADPPTSLTFLDTAFVVFLISSQSLLVRSWDSPWSNRSSKYRQRRISA